MTYVAGSGTKYGQVCHFLRPWQKGSHPGRRQGAPRGSQAAFSTCSASRGSRRFPSPARSFRCERKLLQLRRRTSRRNRHCPRAVSAPRRWWGGYHHCSKTMLQFGKAFPGALSPPTSNPSPWQQSSFCIICLSSVQCYYQLPYMTTAQGQYTTEATHMIWLGLRGWRFEDSDVPGISISNSLPIGSGDFTAVVTGAR